MFEPGRKLTPGMLEGIHGESRELHERHNLPGVHYEAARGRTMHERQQLARANDAHLLLRRYDSMGIIVGRHGWNSPEPAHYRISGR